jgi:hypothetical protein
MRKLIFLFCALSFFSVKAQSATDKIKLLGQAKDTIICFKCGFGKSNTVEKFRILIQSKKYLEIKQLMLSNNAAENYMAAVTCKKLFTQKKLSLSLTEEKLIQKIFNSNKNLYTYSNDTYVEIKPIKYYVYSKEDRLIWTQTKTWLESILK